MSKFEVHISNALTDDSILKMRFEAGSLNEGYKDFAKIINMVYQKISIEQFNIKLIYKGIKDKSIEFISGFVFLVESQHDAHSIFALKRILEQIESFKPTSNYKSFYKKESKLSFEDYFVETSLEEGETLISSPIVDDVISLNKLNEEVSPIVFNGNVNEFRPQAFKKYIFEKIKAGYFPYYVQTSERDLKFKSSTEFVSFIEMYFSETEKSVGLRELKEVFSEEHKVPLVIGYDNEYLYIPDGFDEHAIASYLNQIKDSSRFRVQGLVNTSELTLDNMKTNLMRQFGLINDEEAIGNVFYTNTFHDIQRPFLQYEFNIGNLYIEDNKVGVMMNAEEGVQIMLDAYISSEAFRLFANLNRKHKIFDITQSMIEASNKFNIPVMPDGKMIYQ